MLFFNLFLNIFKNDLIDIYIFKNDLINIDILKNDLIDIDMDINIFNKLQKLEDTLVRQMLTVAPVELQRCLQYVFTVEV